MASYRVLIKPSAAREIEAVDQKKVRQRIVKTILALAVEPRPGCEKLAGENERYRVRVGRYRIVYSIAIRFTTGSEPGRPRQTSQTLELGGSPRFPIAQPQNILERVRGWTWTSMPITTSQGLAKRRHLCPDSTCDLVCARDP